MEEKKDEEGKEEVTKIVQRLRGDNVGTYRELEMTRKHRKCSDKADGLYQKGREKGCERVSDLHL